jgi:hypothetical protein
MLNAHGVDGAADLITTRRWPQDWAGTTQPRLLWGSGAGQHWLASDAHC